MEDWLASLTLFSTKGQNPNPCWNTDWAWSEASTGQGHVWQGRGQPALWATRICACIQHPGHPNGSIQTPPPPQVGPAHPTLFLLPSQNCPCANQTQLVQEWCLGSFCWQHWFGAPVYIGSVVAAPMQKCFKAFFNSLDCALKQRTKFKNGGYP